MIDHRLPNSTTQAIVTRDGQGPSTSANRPSASTTLGQDQPLTETQVERLDHWAERYFQDHSEAPPPP